MALDHRRFYDAKYSAAPQGFARAFPRQIRFLLRWTGLRGRRLRILDLGGGTGEFSFMLQQIGHDVTLFELSPVAVETAKRLGVRKTICGDFTVDPPLEKFDVVLVKGFSPLNTDCPSVFQKQLDSMESLLVSSGIILYWGETDLTGQWTKSGWFCWKPNAFGRFFDDFFVCPALRYQAFMPCWFSRFVSDTIVRIGNLPRPVTLVAYRRVSATSER